MKGFTSLVFLTGALLGAGCAAQAPATSTGTSAGHEDVAAAASAAPPAATNQQQPVSLKSQSASTAPQKDDPTDGYDRVVVEGKELFCRTEATPGTRIRNKVCRTRAELEAQQEAAKQYIDSAQRNAGATGAGQPAMLPGGPY
jgi:hypothetical protein